MILGQDVYHATRPIEYFESDSKYAPVAVRLSIGCVLSGPLPATSSFISSCFKIVIELESDLTEQMKSWYEMESYGAVKEADPRSFSDRRAVEILETTTFNDGTRYQVGILWSKDDLHLPNTYYSALVQSKSPKKRLFSDQDFRLKYEKSIKDDVDKGYVVQVLNLIPCIASYVGKVLYGRLPRLLRRTRESTEESQRTQRTSYVGRI